MKIRKMQNAGVAETPHVYLPYHASPYKSDTQDYYPNIIDNYGLNEVTAEVFRTRKGAKKAAESDAFMGVEKTAMEDPDKLFFNHIYDKKYDKHIEEYDRNYRKWHKKWYKFKAQEPGVYVKRAAEAIAKGEVPARYFDQRYMPEIQRSYEYQTDPDRVTDQRFLNMMAGVANAVPLTAGLIYYAPAAWKILNLPPVQAYFTYQGIKNAFSGNGVQKTWNHFANGEIWNGTKSLIGDVLDIGIPGAQVAKALKFGKDVYNTTNNALDAFKYGSREMPIANLFQDKGYKIGKELFLNPEFKKINNIPIYHGTKYMGDDFVVHGSEPGVHVGTSRVPSDKIVSRQGGTVREGYYTYTGNIGEFNDVSMNTSRALIDQSLESTKDLSKKAYLRKLKDELYDLELYPEYDPIFPPGKIDGERVDRKYVETAKKLLEYYRKEGISGFQYKNLYEGGDTPSMILLNPNDIHLSKNIAHEYRNPYVTRLTNVVSRRFDKQYIDDQIAAQKLAESLDLPNDIYGQSLRNIAEKDAKYYLPIKQAIKDFNGNSEEALKAL